MESEQSDAQGVLPAVLVVGLAALGGAVLGACGGGSPTGSSAINAPALPRVTGHLGRRRGSGAIDAPSPLASPGSAALVQSPLGTVLSRAPARTRFSAVTATCTHEGCAITGFSDSSYVCPATARASTPAAAC
jgi:hypothetical protein